MTQIFYDTHTPSDPAAGTGETLSGVNDAAPRASARAPSIESLQIGMHWFSELPGGLDRIYLSLVRALPEAGVGVRGMVNGDGGAERDSAGAITAFAPLGAALGTRLLAAHHTARRLIRAQRPDIIASHFPLYGLPTLLSGRDCVRVTHFHGPWADEALAEGGGRWSHQFKRVLETLAYTRQQRYIVLSRAFAKLLETRYRVAPGLIDVVPGCVDISRFALPLPRAAARAELGLPTDRPIVLTVRRLAKRMGLENLIDAMAAVVKAVPDALLLIVGRGGLSETLQQRIAERSLEHHVRLLGAVADPLLPLVYRAADVSVVPSLSLEGFGLTTIESLAAGTPVLVTPVGGLPEAVEGLARELILENTDARAIADGIVGALLGSLGLPDEDGCRGYARNGFSAPLMAARVARVYRSALGASSP